MNRIKVDCNNLKKGDRIIWRRSMLDCYGGQDIGTFSFRRGDDFFFKWDSDGNILNLSLFKIECECELLNTN